MYIVSSYTQCVVYVCVYVRTAGAGVYIHEYIHIYIGTVRVSRERINV